MGSKTCCQGLVNVGFLISKVFLNFILLIMSGINLFSAQSPPPITFPALAVLIFKLFKNE